MSHFQSQHHTEFKSMIVSNYLHRNEDLGVWKPVLLKSTSNHKCDGDDGLLDNICELSILDSLHDNMSKNVNAGCPPKCFCFLLFGKMEDSLIL